MNQACSPPPPDTAERDRLYALANSRAATYRYAEALEAYNQVLELDADFADARCDQGNLFARLGLLDQAVEAYEQILETDSTHVRTLHNLSVIRADQGRYPEAIQLLEGARTNHPDYAPGLHTLALFYAKQGLYEQAESTLLKILELAPEGAEARQQLGRLYLRQGRYEEAENLLRQAADLAPDNGETWRHLGLLFMDMNRPQAALGAFEKTLRIDSEQVEIHFNLANAQLALGREEDADRSMQRFELLSGHASQIAQLRRALDGDPEDIDAHLNLAYQYAEMNRPAAAGHHYSAVLVFAPDHLETRLKLSNHHLQQGNREEALRLCMETIARHPEHPEIFNFHFIAGYLHLAAQRLEKAQIAFDRTLQLKPDHAKGWNNMGNLQVMKNDFAAASLAYDKALKANPEFAEASFNLGSLLLRQRKFEQARHRFRQTVAIDSTYARAYYALGAVYEEQDSTSAAVHAYQRFLTDWRGDPDTARLVQRKLAALR